MAALLKDAAEHNESLVMPDHGEHDFRLRMALDARNRRMVREGQPERMHACTVCEKFIPGDGFKGLRSFIFCFSRAGVSDSTTIRSLEGCSH